MIEIRDLGRVRFQETEILQRELVAKRMSEGIPDTLLLLEHFPVITMGRRESAEDLLVPKESLQEQGIDFVETDRGGRLTYHAPGQLVGYFIFKLGKKTIPQFVSAVEESLIRLLHQYTLKGSKDCHYPGVWIGQKKIAALGLHFEKGVSRHGFALNVDCDLRPYQLMYPCGIRERGVTSILNETGIKPMMSEVKKQIQNEVSLVPTRL
ncbi:MAG: lipoyl(octanoyl) transferase LipB [Deltaproteobacteria bacterium]|nr:lipoyl(octanoyl) transferase LipB [Deltaproteobacteria bacterium]